MGNTFGITGQETRDEVTIKLQARQTLISVLNWIQLFGVMYLIFQSVVVGYAIVSTPGGTYAVPHTVWIVAPVVAFAVVAYATRFEVGLYIDPLISGIRYTYVVLALCWVANAAAMALFIWEWTQGVSNFYTQSYGYLIATVVVTGLFVLLELLLIFAIYVFHRDLDHAWAEGWTPQYTKKDPQYSEPKDKMDDEERLLQGGSGSGGDGGDFDIKSQLRRTRIQVRTRLVK